VADDEIHPLLPGEGTAAAAEDAAIVRHLAATALSGRHLYDRYQNIDGQR
jgi:hypothetical protein